MLCDLSFLVLKNFLTNNIDEVQSIEKEPETPKVMHSDFANSVYEILCSARLVVCYHQDHVDVAYEQEAIMQKVQERFLEHFYHIEVPTDEESEADYFHMLSSAMGVQGIKSADKWKKVMKKRLQRTQARVLFVFSNIAEGNETLNVKMAKVIRSLQNQHPNFYALCMGRKDLAYLVHGNRKLSPLNTATELFFPVSETHLSESQVVQTLKSLQAHRETICDCVEDSWRESWSTWSYEKGINDLFWKSILVNEKGQYAWRKSDYRSQACEILGCK